VDGGLAADEGTDRVIASAVSVLRYHTPDAGGCCLGCLAWWRRLVPFPCEQAKWAMRVRAAYRDKPDGQR
jgi:hypothetical protein